MNSLVGNVFKNGTSNLIVTRMGTDYMASISNLTTGMSVPLRLVPGTSNLLTTTICGNSPFTTGFCSRVSVGPGNTVNIPGLPIFNMVVRNQTPFGTLTVSSSSNGSSNVSNVILRSSRGTLASNAMVTIAGQDQNTMNALTRNVLTTFSNLTYTQGQIVPLPGALRNTQTRMNLNVSSGTVSNLVSFNYRHDITGGFRIVP